MRCRFKHKIFQNEGNGYTIAIFTTQDTSVPLSARDKYLASRNIIGFSAIGFGLPLTDEIELEMEGRWESGEHGTQYQVENFMEVVPRTKEGILGYLSSGAIKGIGPKMADTIFRKFGLQTLEIMENNPQELLKIRGISEKKLAAIVESYGKNQVFRELMTFLAPFKVTPKKVNMILKKFGNESVDIIRHRPYMLSAVKGFGFLTVDAIGRQCCCALNDPMRISGCIGHIMNQAMKEELQEGKDVCLMNKQYARMHACEIGDMIQIRDKRLKVIGLIDNSVYSGMIIPYQTMLNVYKEEKDIQFSGTFFCENELQKQKRIDEVIEQIKEKDNHADILGVTEGEELYKNALYTKIQWRIVRGMCALVAILFFMINETIVLMAKAKKERKIMGINLALGATERDIKYCLFFETLLVTLLAVFLVMITLRPLAKLASLEHIIILDSMVIVETVILAVWACEILTWIIVSRIKKENIADMVRTTRDI